MPEIQRVLENARAGAPAQCAVANQIVLYGAVGSGSIAVEAALVLLGIPYELVEGATWAEGCARERVAPVNPMRQIPALVLPSSEVLTESAAILIHLADSHPQAGLAPHPGDRRRAQFLRWMVYVSSAIYSLHWIKPDVRRIGAPPDLAEAVVEAVHDRIAFCWKVMDEQIGAAPYLLGDRLSVLDLYVTVVSRFGPWRTRFYAVAPKMADVVRRVDAEPRLKEFWNRRFPFDDDWE
jgi:GST-like protein